METTTKKARVEPTREEQGEQAIATVELLYKINLIAVKVRRSGVGFLANQQPAINERSAQMAKAGIKNDDDFVAIAKVDFPDEKNPSPTGETAGTLSWVTNRKYPMRGFAVAETVHTLSMFKRMFRITLEKLSRHKIKTALMFLLFRRVVEEMALGMIDGFYSGMEKHLFKDERYSQPVREVRRVFDKMFAEDGGKRLEDMPLPKNREEKMANIALLERSKPMINLKDSISALLEFDDAYRYRFQWLFKYDGQGKAIAKAPIRELRKMFATLLERESDLRLRQQWKAFRTFVWVLAIHRPLRKEVQRFFNELDVREVYMSIEDKYHAIDKASFDFGLPPRDSYK